MEDGILFQAVMVRNKIYKSQIAPYQLKNAQKTIICIEFLKKVINDLDNNVLCKF